MVGCKALQALLSFFFFFFLLLLLLLPSGGEGSRGVAKLALWTQFDDQGLSEALDAAEAWAVIKDEDGHAWRLGSSSTWGESTSTDEDQEDGHPADEMLAHHHVDGSTSYVLSGY